MKIYLLMRLRKKMQSHLKAFFLCALLVCGALRAEPVKYAVVAVLDKVTTKVAVFHVKVGEEIVVRDRIKVRAMACDAPKESSFHKDAKKCFIEIFDCGLGERNERMIFSKWMFRDYPVVGSLEHSRYDVWVIDCSARALVQ